MAVIGDGMTQSAAEESGSPGILHLPSDLRSALKAVGVILRSIRPDFEVIDRSFQPPRNSEVRFLVGVLMVSGMQMVFLN